MTKINISNFNLLFQGRKQPRYVKLHKLYISQNNIEIACDSHKILFVNDLLVQGFFSAFGTHCLHTFRLIFNEMYMIMDNSIDIMIDQSDWITYSSLFIELGVGKYEFFLDIKLSISTFLTMIIRKHKKLKKIFFARSLSTTARKTIMADSENPLYMIFSNIVMLYTIRSLILLGIIFSLELWV